MRAGRSIRSVPCIAIVIAIGLLLPACVLVSGPNCSDACEKVKSCEGLQGTFLLACSPIGTGCTIDVLACAECIDASTCEELIGGACQSECVPPNG